MALLAKGCDQAMHWLSILEAVTRVVQGPLVACERNLGEVPYGLGHY